MASRPIQTIAINDPVVNSIVEHYRSEVGDKTLTKTAGRIIQAFHSAGMKLLPERNDNDPSNTHESSKGRILDVSA